MKLLEFLHKIDEEALLEAAKDRYLQMFQNLPLPGPENLEFADTDKKIAERVQWAIQTFKKSNAITWYLRYYRLFILKSLASKPVEDESQEPWLVKAKQMYAKEVRRQGSKSGLGDSISGYVDTVVMPAEMQKFAHFMSLPVEGIQNYPFEWQTPYDVISDFTTLESAWQESRRGQVPQRDTHSIVLQFEDGSAWVNLNKAGCTEEGEAMGHCGNEPTQRDGQTVISYRTPEVDDDGNPTWKPHLTFIFDTVTGYMGEMKGRNNNKPDPKYHKVIMKLLEQPLIKGIVGGGYKPENNFRMSDLSEEDFDYLSELKPELLEPYDQYLMNGREVTPDLVEKLDEMLSTDHGLQFDGYDEENNVFVLDKNYGNVEDIFGAYNESTDVYIDDDDISSMSKEIMEKHLSKDELATLGRYFNQRYPEEDPIKDTEMENADKIYTALSDESDDVTDVFNEAIKEVLQEMATEEAIQQVNNLSELGIDDDNGDNGVWVDEFATNEFRIVAEPEEFLENGLPNVNSDTAWLDMTGAMYLRDPDEDIREQLFSEYGDEDYKERVLESIADVVKKNSAFQQALRIGENPGITAEREHGQERLFASKGIRK